MIAVSHRRGQTLYVFGLGHSGISAIRALVAGGARALAWDDRAEPRAQAEAAGAETASPETLDWTGIDAVVLSPGVPLTHPEPHAVVKTAQANGVAVIGDTELFVQQLRHSGSQARLVAITGTNGKSTTTALVGHILAQAGLAVEVGGNIGSSAVLELSPDLNHGVYVIEFSSYQIDLTPSLKPDVAVFLNLSPDHLDRHGDMAGYAAVKAKIFARQGPGDVLVLGQDDPMTAAMAGTVPAGVRLIPISAGTAQAGGVWTDGTHLMSTVKGDTSQIADLDGIASLRGGHNRQNAAAAAAVALALDVQPDALAPGFASFPGLPHRMELVGRSGTVLFVNDSKATNAEAAEKALASYRDIHWIAGGVPKAGGIASLAPLFDRIAQAYLIGEAAEDFSVTLKDSGVGFEMCGTLENAVAAASRDALASTAPEPCVLLSPACASFDQFTSFEVRGDAFRNLVAERTAGEEGT